MDKRLSLFCLNSVQRLLGQLLGAFDRNAFMLIDDQGVAFLIAAVQQNKWASAIGLNVHIGRA